MMEHNVPSPCFLEGTQTIRPLFTDSSCSALCALCRVSSLATCVVTEPEKQRTTWPGFCYDAPNRGTAC